MPYKDPSSDRAKRSLKERQKRYRQTPQGKELDKRQRVKRREIRSKEHSRWRSQNLDYCQERLWKLRYGISRVEFDQMRAEQNNTCIICLREFANTPCVDHSHLTGKNRGLLCKTCNRALGMLGDSSEVLNRAAEYLRKHEETNG